MARASSSRACARSGTWSSSRTRSTSSPNRLAAKLGHASLFANRFELDAEGRITGFKLRIRGQKERIVSGFKSAGYKVAAMGDSLNDLSLWKSCDFPVLYRPVEALAREFPGVVR